MKPILIRGIPDEERLKLEAKAKEKGLKLTAYCRMVLIKAANSSVDITGEIKSFFT